jgi:hypothetical protein
LIFILLGNRLRAASIGQSEPGSITDINISNIIGINTIWPIIISGLLEKRIENIHISNLRLLFRSDQSKYLLWKDLEQSIKNENLDSKYPDPEMFRGFPAKILFMKNCSNVAIIDFSCQIEDIDEVPLIGLYYCESVQLSGKIASFRFLSLHASPSTPLYAHGAVLSSPAYNLLTPPAPWACFCPSVPCQACPEPCRGGQPWRAYVLSPWEAPARRLARAQHRPPCFRPLRAAGSPPGTVRAPGRTRGAGPLASQPPPPPAGSEDR